LVDLKAFQVYNLIAAAGLTVVVSLFYVPPTVSSQSVYQLNLFGVYAGTVSIYGLHLEHEWAGVGLLLVAVALWRFADLDGWPTIILSLFGVVLFFSDYNEVFGINGVQMSVVANTLGSLASVLVGALYGVFIGGIVGVDLLG